MVYISHLDVMRLLSRAARRAGVPIALTQGFSPHPRIRLERAVKLGESFEGEPGEMVLEDLMAPDELTQRFCQALPEGIDIKDIVLVPVH